MSADTFMLDGRAYSWRKLCQLRREQLEAIRKARGQQDALFELKEDCRPVSQQTTSGRYAEPTLLELVHDGRCAETIISAFMGRFRFVLVRERSWTIFWL